MATTLAARKASRETRLGQHEGRRAPFPLGRHGPHRQDDRGERAELGEVLPRLIGRVGRDGGRERDRWQLVAGRRLDDLGQELGEQRRREPDEQEETGDDRQPQRPPRLEQLLAEQDRDAGHAAASVPGSRPTSRRKTSSSEGRARSNAARRTPAVTTSGSRPADAALPSVTDTIRRVPSARTSSTQGDSRRRAAQRFDGRLLAGLGFEAVERLGIPAQELVERTFRDEPAVVDDPDPVADPLDVGQDVRREQDRGAGAQPLDQCRGGRGGPPGRGS